MKIPVDILENPRPFVWTGGPARKHMTPEGVARELAGTATVDDFPLVTIVERNGWASDGRGRLVRRLRAPNALVRAADGSQHVARHSDLHEREGFVPPAPRGKPERADMGSPKRAAAEKLAGALAANTGLPFGVVLVGGDWFVQLNPRSPACVAYRA